MPNIIVVNVPIKINYGHKIVADRGFTISETLRSYITHSLSFHLLLEAKKQLNPGDVKLTGQTAGVQKHVKRVIGANKKKNLLL